jgi:hypothetical protein
MLVDFWGMVNTIIIPNGNNCITDVGNGSGGVKGGGGNDILTVSPPPPSPPLVLLVIVIVFNATSLLPAVAPVDRQILPPIGSNTHQCNGDHGEEIPLTACGGTTNVGAGGGGGCSRDLNSKQRMT